jgi:hypothetical protein
VPITLSKLVILAYGKMTALCQLVSNRTCIVVVQGDILTVLAKHHYNDPKLVNWIFQAKLDTLDHPDDLFIGTELRIPLPPQPPPAPEVKVAGADWRNRTRPKLAGRTRAGCC